MSVAWLLLVQHFQTIQSMINIDNIAQPGNIMRSSKTP